MRTVKADLHMHGPIGFQQYWLNKQGYAGKNLLQLISDECFRKGIIITAITSQADEIPAGSVHDRLAILRDVEAPLLPAEYKTGTLGGQNNILVVEKGENRVYVVNGQTAMPCENSKRYDLLVIGSNQVPNKKSFEDTLCYCEDNGLIKIAEHPFLESHGGMGEELLERYIDRFDAVEGFNAQAIFQSFLTRLPFVGKTFFSRAGRDSNEKAKQIAAKYGKSYISTSDAHRIEDLGISHIVLETQLNDENEEKFLAGLRFAIREGLFFTYERYLNYIGWIKWVYTFQRGITSPDRKDDEKYIPSNQLRNS